MGDFRGIIYLGNLHPRVVFHQHNGHPETSRLVFPLTARPLLLIDEVHIKGLEQYARENRKAVWYFAGPEEWLLYVRFRRNSWIKSRLLN